MVNHFNFVHFESVQWWSVFHHQYFPIPSWFWSFSSNHQYNSVFSICWLREDTPTIVRLVTKSHHIMIYQSDCFSKCCLPTAEPIFFIFLHFSLIITTVISFLFEDGRWVTIFMLVVVRVTVYLSRLSCISHPLWISGWHSSIEVYWVFHCRLVKFSVYLIFIFKVAISVSRWLTSVTRIIYQIEDGFIPSDRCKGWGCPGLFGWNGYSSHRETWLPSLTLHGLSWLLDR